VDAPLAVAATYFGALVGGFALVAIWETVAAARPARVALPARWAPNLALLALNQGLLPFLTPLSNAGAAWLAGERGIGLFHALDVPSVSRSRRRSSRWTLRATRCTGSLHANRLLWRLHRVHHSDLDYDLTVGLRFHPLEALFANAVLAAVVLALGAPFWAVVASDAITIAHGSSRTATSRCRRRSTARCDGSWSRRGCTRCTTASRSTSR
jgi:hypothetical protein